MLLVASRVDVAGDGRRLATLREFCREQGRQLFEISAVTGEGLDKLKWASWAALEQLPSTSPPVITPEPERQ